MQQIQELKTLDELVPGTKFLEVEVFGNGEWFQVGTVLEVMEAPRDDVPYSRRRASIDEVLPSKWPTRAHRWYVVVKNSGGKKQDAFAMSVPSKSGVTIDREEGDHSAFVVYTPEVEQELRTMRSINEYRIFAGLWRSLDEYRRLVGGILSRGFAN